MGSRRHTCLSAYDFLALGPVNDDALPHANLDRREEFLARDALVAEQLDGLLCRRDIMDVTVIGAGELINYMVFMIIYRLNEIQSYIL